MNYIWVVKKYLGGFFLSTQIMLLLLTTMSANANNQNKTAKPSCESLGELIDEISPKITDNEYLQLMNALTEILHIVNKKLISIFFVLFNARYTIV